MFVPFDHVQSHTRLYRHTRSIYWAFLSCLDHVKSTRIDGCRMCDRSHGTTVIDQISRTGPGQSLYFFLTGKNAPKNFLRFFEAAKIKSNREIVKSKVFSRWKNQFTFSSEICKNRAKISKIFNLILGVKIQTYGGFKFCRNILRGGKIFLFFYVHCTKYQRPSRIFTFA